MIKQEHNEHCQEIADRLHNIAVGTVYKCSECGEFYESEEDAENCCEYGEAEQLSMWDYFEDDIYDIKYVISSNFDYYAARIMIACGGPNIYVNTETKTVDLYWWGEEGHAELSSEAVFAIDEFAEEMFEMR